jgi:hypothetical protein
LFAVSRRRRVSASDDGAVGLSIFIYLTMNNLILNSDIALPRTARGQQVHWNDIKTATIEIYRQHVVVKRKYVRADVQKRSRLVADGGSDGMGGRVEAVAGGGAELDLEPVSRRKGAAIQVFSHQSVKRLRFACDELSWRFKSMFTLTYPDAYISDGRRVKRHLDTFIKFLKRFLLKTYGHVLAGLWFLEFQKRGAPHFHLFTNYVISMLEFRKLAESVSEAWYRIVSSGDKNHLMAGTRCELLREKHAASAYAVKYAEKFYQKNVPEDYDSVGRFWGVFGCKVKPHTVVAGVAGDTARLARETIGPVLFTGIFDVTRLVRVARRAAAVEFERIRAEKERIARKKAEWEGREYIPGKFRKASPDGGLWPKTFFRAAAAVMAYLTGLAACGRSLDLAEVH